MRCVTLFQVGHGNFLEPHRSSFSLAQCIGLPNLDVGGFLGNKTDAFVAVVYEDACESKSLKLLASTVPFSQFRHSLFLVLQM